MPAEQQALRALQRPVCALLQCRFPLVLAGTDAAGPAWVGTVAQAGGFAMLDLGDATPDQLQAVLGPLRDAGGCRFGVRLAGDGAAQIETLAALRVAAVWLGAAPSPATVARASAAGLPVLQQVCSAAQARAAHAAGVQALVVALPPADAPALVADVLAATPLPVLGQAGAMQAGAVAALLSQGAQGAVIVLPACGADAAAEGMRALALDVAGLLGADLWGPPPVVLSSPVCYARELDHAHRDLVARDDLLDALNELLEAERAGARTAFALLRASGDAGISDVLHAVHRGEVRWCGMLMAAVHRLGASPSTRTGDFYAKVMAVPDLHGRLALLNRGQAWVVRRLEALAPRVGDEDLRDALEAMLAAHRDNIGLVDTQLHHAPH
ncbi:DUF6306 domain-containing protein [Pseudorhodoferax sp.]|uniref:DUF6306 domain-containing protein n=1 Tax=Pseudorhodoferax sp. TaxID=1993553 RepID=UPI002DD64E0F|nr:DUF6306 domain-containing protein [Pseudorhodoferax sp.]